MTPCGVRCLVNISSDNDLLLVTRTNTDILQIPRNKVQWNWQQDTKLFINEYAFEIVICKMAAILFKHQCVNGCMGTSATINGHFYLPNKLDFGHCLHVHRMPPSNEHHQCHPAAMHSLIPVVCFFLQKYPSQLHRRGRKPGNRAVVSTTPLGLDLTRDCDIRPLTVQMIISWWGQQIAPQTNNVFIHAQCVSWMNSKDRHP